jgi:hypothetical protein
MAMSVVAKNKLEEVIAILEGLETASQVTSAIEKLTEVSDKVEPKSELPEITQEPPK